MIPTTVLNDISNAKRYFLDLLDQQRKDMETGSEIKTKALSGELINVIDDLSFRIEAGYRDEATQRLYDRMMTIIGSYGIEPIPEPEGDRTIYFGVKSTNVLPTGPDVLAGDSVQITSGEDYTLPLQTLGAGYIWFAELQSEPIKTAFEDTVTPSNNGPIGSGTGVFGRPLATVESLRVGMTRYETLFVNPITFKQ